MATHAPEGSTLCIHSVCVDAAERRRGVASKLLRTYVHAVVPGMAPHVRRVRLIAKPYLAELYTRAGFACVGPSAVVHGADEWHEFCFAYADDEA